MTTAGYTIGVDPAVGPDLTVTVSVCLDCGREFRDGLGLFTHECLGWLIAALRNRYWGPIRDAAYELVPA